jgi:predicted nicotinamide N-methyase
MQSQSDPRYALKLLKRLERMVELEHVHTEIAGTSYPWARVVNPDQLLEQTLRNEQPESASIDPFWAATWRAAQGLDRFLGTLQLPTDSRILELGGGSGRAGISAALRGASVCITDASRMALIMCRFNARFVSDRVTVRKLDWANLAGFHERFPIVLGSDIVYNPSLYPILEPCMRQVLEPNGVVLLSEPQRHTGDRFENWIRQAGWQCDSCLIDLKDGQREIRIFQCTLNPLKEFAS